MKSDKPTIAAKRVNVNLKKGAQPIMTKPDGHLTIEIEETNYCEYYFKQNTKLNEDYKLNNQTN
jgi:hypothetical protein